MAETTKQLEGIVDNIVKEIEARLEDRITNTITTQLKSRVDEFDFNNTVAYLASVKLDSLLAGLEIDSKVIEKRIKTVSDTVLENLKQEAQAQMTQAVNSRLASIDINSTLRTTIAAEVSQMIRRFEFPDKSIPNRAVDFEGLQLSGDHIGAGMIKKFSSSGIDDRATTCQVTILDAATVIENKIVTNNLEVKGTTVLEGDIILRGQVPTDTPLFQDLVDTSKHEVINSLNANLFANYSTIIFDKIKEEGLDLNRITLNGAEVIKGSQLNYAISDTNITRVGLLKELQVQGEALINQTLYVGKEKLGINTMEPGFALTVWDEEVEIGAGKRKRDVGFMGTMGRQDLILTANMKDNIILGADGSVQVEKISINKVTLGSTTTAPGHSGERGTVLFNDNPELGAPAGWVCLGGTRWASFGTLS